MTRPTPKPSMTPNLVPMIDIMFLLLLFFMLGADMGHRELEDVALPKAKSVEADKPAAAEGRITVNVYRPPGTTVWRIGVSGVDLDETALRARMASEANASSGGRRVMIRADERAPYGEVQRVMGACARAGLYRIECGAAEIAR